MPQKLSDSGADLLDVAAAAEYLSTGERMARRLVAERRVPVVRIGRHVRFRRADLDAFIAASTAPAREPA